MNHIQAVFIGLLAIAATCALLAAVGAIGYLIAGFMGIPIAIAIFFLLGLCWAIGQLVLL